MSNYKASNYKALIEYAFKPKSERIFLNTCKGCNKAFRASVKINYCKQCRRKA